MPPPAGTRTNFGRQRTWHQSANGEVFARVDMRGSVLPIKTSYVASCRTDAGNRSNWFRKAVDRSEDFVRLLAIRRAQLRSSA